MLPPAEGLVSEQRADKTYLTDQFWQALDTNKGIAYFTDDGALWNATKTARVGCYDLSGGEWQGAKTLTLVKFVVGVVILLFIIVLIIGVFAGFAYPVTGKDGSKLHDIFYGQGLTADGWGMVFWFTGMTLMAVAMYSITKQKWGKYQGLNENSFVNGLGATIESSIKQHNDWLSW